MKTRKLHLLMVCALLCITKILPAQENVQNQPGEIYSGAFREEISLFTDRSLYAVGEEILFKALYQTNSTGSKRLSTVLYLELIKPDGTALVQKKLPLTNDDVNGVVQIPEHILSGTYYLKAYTKWMRNYPAESYGYLLLKIVNPAKTDVSKVLNGNGNGITPGFKKTENISGLAVKLNKTAYGTRERVNVALLADAANSCYYCISVAKKGAKDVLKTWIKPNIEWPAENTPAKFYPEIKGVTLSGKVLDNSHSTPVENAEVSMSLLSNTSYLLKSATNKNGEFIFSLPENGEMHDFFINAEKEEQELAIEIDKDFCNKPIALKNLPVDFTDQEKNVANEICVNAQILKAYNSTTDSTFVENPEKPFLSFYGKPQKTFYTKTYINVPTIHDFIVEIVREIKLEKGKLVPSYNSSLNNSFGTLPYLLMLDNVPISDISKILSIVTEKIDRVELNNFGYVLGNRSYCGVISVFSKNNDMAGIELPKNSMFFRYSLLDKVGESSLNKGTKELSNTHLPDRRNCLYWNPGLKTTSGEKQHFSFFTSDVPGEYQILVQAISRNSGEPVFYQQTFVVE